MSDEALSLSVTRQNYPLYLISDNNKQAELDAFNAHWLG